MHTVPYDLLMTPAHPGYVARWLFDRIQERSRGIPSAAPAARVPEVAAPSLALHAAAAK